MSRSIFKPDFFLLLFPTPVSKNQMFIKVVSRPNVQKTDVGMGGPTL